MVFPLELIAVNYLYNIQSSSRIFQCLSLETDCHTFP